MCRPDIGHFVATVSNWSNQFDQLRPGRAPARRLQQLRDAELDILASISDTPLRSTALTRQPPWPC